ncbi:phosphonate metabolism protein/1,5-bisphosphokinase (PRPP-forming) PhnN [Aliiroseovarius sp. KMU-50]|uniref:Ribose 1,5-bisphosphate phosphokinase PhnN n=1 Tax=Aliiroseovarius salicola TaxID=3009082 RepID=A0ABT4VZT9_9RHOB|nr:phosphonate metabolism protein/1,5-bisphosphokinase (PRPP-forming) PhnN [Aliiroseovarius sp. KMU-50]MDA5093778.1 phosphonate metabolism protein/1,5-bisphosphokinase (PRPP-forming) PhnN [Aliiroseovarius sp. KMU-50]
MPTPRTGRLIAVVGPSGVGKDSVMQALATATDFRIGRRVITRPSEAGGERFESCDDTAFEKDLLAGRFALHWQAHGLRYGVPKAELARLKQGRTVLVNLSRTVLAEAQAKFPQSVISLTASPEVLAKRLAARGRESEDGIARRLARRVALPVGVNAIEVTNDGPLVDTVHTILSALADQTAPDAPSAMREIS